MYRKDIESSLLELGSSINGLSNEVAQQRLIENGRNTIVVEQEQSIFSIFFKSFKDVMILVLILAAILSVALKEYTDAILILAIIFLNAVIGTIQEVQAKRAVKSLKDLSASNSLVLRDGSKVYVSSEELVVGDIVLLETGDIVPADGRIIESFNLQVDESVLTGEAVAVDKDPEFVASDNIPIADRKNLVFASTVVTRGHAKFVVTNTAMSTEIGKIAFMVMSQEESKTPLQVKLDKVGKLLAVLVIVLAILIFGLGILQERDKFEMLLIAVTIAVAAIPEGLPTVVSIVLALGTSRLSKQNAVVKGLSSVETLGSASVICTDKTGTLTQNKMTVQEFSTYADISHLIRGMVLCNDADVDGERSFGDPTEVALIRWAQSQEVDFRELKKNYRRIDEIGFDSHRKMMSTVNDVDGRYIQYTKGALDNILDRCTTYLDSNLNEVELDERIKLEILEKNSEYTDKALRVLSLARKTYRDNLEELNEMSLCYIGMVAMIDPPRVSVREAIMECKSAGVIPVMITGDHLDTAKAIGQNIGLYDPNEHLAITGLELDQISDEDLFEKIEKIRIYARVAPEQKRRIVSTWQKKDNIVAMTGDGVNDAPAIKMADIGIAMGKSGTDVSREAAHMILMDDDFSTIVSAIRGGRTIYDNIKRTIRYLLSCNLGEIIAIVATMLLGLPMPLLPIHILWINLISDGMPALALGFEGEDSDVMKKPPKSSKEGIFNTKTILIMLFEGLFIGGLSLAAFIITYRIDPQNLVQAQTVAFLTLALTQLVHGANVRSEGSLFKKGIFSNRVYLFTFVISIIIEVLMVTVSPIARIFKLENIGISQWILVAILSVVPLVITELRKLIVKG